MHNSIYKNLSSMASMCQSDCFPWSPALHGCQIQAADISHGQQCTPAFLRPPLLRCGRPYSLLTWSHVGLQEVYHIRSTEEERSNHNHSIPLAVQALFCKVGGACCSATPACSARLVPTEVCARRHPGQIVSFRSHCADFEAVSDGHVWHCAVHASWKQSLALFVCCWWLQVSP